MCVCVCVCVRARAGPGLQAVMTIFGEYEFEQVLVFIVLGILVSSPRMRCLVKVYIVFQF